MEHRDHLKCRLCRRKDNFYIDIFNPAGTNNLLVWQVIKEITGLDVTRDDGLPPTTCQDCMQKLTDFKRFKTLCINSRIDFLKDIVFEGMLEVPREESPMVSHTANVLTLPSSFPGLASEVNSEKDPSDFIIDKKPVVSNGVIVDERSYQGCPSEGPNDDIPTSKRSHSGNTPMPAKHHRVNGSQQSGESARNGFPNSSRRFMSPPRVVDSPVSTEAAAGNDKDRRYAFVLRPRKSAEVVESGGCARTSACFRGRNSAGTPLVVGADGLRILHPKQSRRMVPNPYHEVRRKASSGTASGASKFGGWDVTSDAKGSNTSGSFSHVSSLANRSGSSHHVDSSGKVRKVPHSSLRCKNHVYPSVELGGGERGNHSQRMVLKDCSVILKDIFLSLGDGADSKDLIVRKIRGLKLGKSRVRSNVNGSIVKMEPGGVFGDSGRYVFGENCGENSKTNVGVKQEVQTERLKAKKEFKSSGPSAGASSLIKNYRKTRHCSKCQLVFTSNYEQQKHMSFVHRKNNPKTNCSVCKKTFIYPYLLREHEKHHNATLPFWCQPCRSGFPTKKSLQSHTYMSHGRCKRQMKIESIDSRGLKL